MYNVLSDMSNGSGGVLINVKDIINDNLLDHVEGLNPNLGTATDEYYEKYRKFLDRIGSREFDIVRVEDIARNEYKDYDLSEDNPIVNAALSLVSDFIINLKAKITANDRFDESKIITASSDGSKFIKSNYTFTFEDRIKTKIQKK